MLTANSPLHLAMQQFRGSGQHNEIDYWNHTIPRFGALRPRRQILHGAASGLGSSVFDARQQHLRGGRHPY